LTNGRFRGKKGERESGWDEEGGGVWEDFGDDALVCGGVVVFVEERFPAEPVADEVLIETDAEERVIDAGEDAEVVFHADDVAADGDGDEGHGGVFSGPWEAGHVAEGDG